MKFTFTNEVKEHIQGYKLYCKNTSQASVDKIISVILGFCGTWNLILNPSSWIGYAAVILSCLAWFDLFGIATLKTKLEFKRNPKFSEEYTIDVDDEGIKFDTRTINSIVKWDHYSKYLEDGKCFLLVYGKAQYTFVPKRVFKDDSQVNEFRSLLNRNIGK